MAVDFSEVTEKIVRKIEEMANLCTQVWVIHVAEPDPEFMGYASGPPSVREYLAKQFHEEHRQIQDIAESLRGKEIEATALLVQGATAETIVKEAAKLKVDMIVMGSRGRGMVSQIFVGSVSQAVLHRAECPVLVIPTHAR